MASLRMLCENYIRIDDEIMKLNEAIDNSKNYAERQHYVAEYLQKYMEREDFKSGMRRHLITELVEGIKPKME